MTSPLIDDLEWGQITTVVGNFKDAKLWPGGGRDWDWTETGTHHSPGIQPADVEELLDNGSRIIVLSQGMWQKLKTKPETLKLLKQKDIITSVLKTKAAVKRYNELAQEDKPVGGLFHSTC